MDSKKNALGYLSERINESPVKPFVSSLKLYLEFNKEFHTKVINSCQELGLDFEEISNTAIEIILSKYIYFDEQDFLTRYKYQSETDFTECSIAILSYDKKPLIKTENELFKPEKAIIFNYRQYLDFLSYIGEKQNFVDYHNTISREFIIVSQQSNIGVIKLGYIAQERRIGELPDLSIHINRLIRDFSQKEFVVFFRDRIFEAIGQKYETKDRVFEILKILPSLLDKAEKDYQIFLKKFNLENIKSRFKEQRIKYFENLDKNLETINKQIASVPLSFSATAFAGYQVKDKSFILFLVIIGFILYTILSWKSLNLALLNIENVEEDVKKESDKIEKEFAEINEDFKNDFNKIRLKVKKIRQLITFIKGIMLALLILFVLFSIYQVLYVTPSKPSLEFKLT